MGKPSKLIQRIKPIDTRTAKTQIVERVVGRRLQKSRQRILLRDEYTCQMCGRVCLESGLEIDHIVPLHIGGGDNDQNKQALCISCHNEKSKKEGVNRDNGGS